MKRIIVALLSTLTLICKAQISFDFEILEVNNLQGFTDSLVKELDKGNPNQLIRLPILDSAAKHHIEYLIMHTMNTDSLTHREYIDYPNFEEKEKSEDRTGFKNQTSEICHVTSTSTLVHPKIKTKHSEIFMHRQFSYKSTFESYRNSPGHWSIATDKSFKYVGSYSVDVFYKSKRGLTKKDIEFGFERIIHKNFNVTVYIQDPNKKRGQ
jgi:hypothetical protein